MRVTYAGKDPNVWPGRVGFILELYADTQLALVTWMMLEGHPYAARQTVVPLDVLVVEATP